MKHFILSLFGAFMITLSCIAQTLTNSEALRLQLIVQDYLNAKKAFIKDTPRRPEVMLLILDIDSVGKVSDVHLLADLRSRDTVSSLLSNITVKDFSQWKSDSCFNKTLVQPVAGLPVESIPKGSEYAERLFFDFLWSRQRPGQVLYENGRVIFLSAFVY